MVLITLFQFVSMWSISTKNEIIALLHLLFYFASTLTTQNEIKKIQNEKILHYFKTCCNTAGAFTKSVQHLCVCFFFFFFFFFFLFVLFSFCKVCYIMLLLHIYELICEHTAYLVERNDNATASKAYVAATLHDRLVGDRVA